MFKLRDILVVTVTCFAFGGLVEMAFADPPNVQKLVGPVIDLPVHESHAQKKLEDDITELKAKVAYLEIINSIIEKEMISSDGLDDFRTKPAFSAFTKDWVDRAADHVRQVIYTSAYPNYTFTQVDGHGSILGSKSGDIAIDGIEFQGFNNYDFENGQPNRIFVSAPGLATSGKNLTLYGDSKHDEAILDGCLYWKKQKRPNGLNFWKAKDVDGKMSGVLIPDALLTSVSKACDNRYVFRKKLLQIKSLYAGDPRTGIIAMMPGLEKLGMTDEGRWEDETENYVQSYYDIIGELRSSQKIPEDDAKSLTKIVDMIRDKKIPPVVPFWADGHRNPNIFLLRKWDIKNATYSDGSIRIIGENIQGDLSMKRYGELIYLKPKYFTQNIENDCSLADMSAARIGRWVDNAKNDLGGVGISPQRDNNNNILVQIADPQGGVAQAGIKNGDVITKINGQSAKSLSDASVIGMLRGKINTKVFLTVLSPQKKSKKFTVTRRRLGPEFISELKIYQTGWPQKYLNFMIVDGTKQPVTFSVEGSVKNVMTIPESKTKIKFSGDACYNIMQITE